MNHPIDSDAEIIDAEIIEPGTAIEPTSIGGLRGDIIAVDEEFIGGELLHLDGLRAIRSAMLDLDDQRLALVEAGDVDRLANGAADLKVVIGDLNTLHRNVRSDLAAMLIHRHEVEGGNPKRRPKVEVEGLGVVEVPSGRERKNWKSVELVRRLVTEAIVDTETGEMRHDSVPKAVAEILKVLEDCLPLTGSLGWRVGTFDKVSEEWTGLRGHGIDPDDWSDEVEKDRLAEIPKRATS